MFADPAVCWLLMTTETSDCYWGRFEPHMTMGLQLSGSSLLQSKVGGLMSEYGAADEKLFKASIPFYPATLTPTSTAGILGSIHRAF